MLYVLWFAPSLGNLVCIFIPAFLSLAPLVLRGHMGQLAATVLDSAALSCGGFFLTLNANLTCCRVFHVGLCFVPCASRLTSRLVLTSNYK